jgi:hypothetical protein
MIVPSGSMVVEEERDGIIPSTLLLRQSPQDLGRGVLMLIPRLDFPGNCKGKTGADPTKLDSEYVDFLARSFETQTWVYEKAVRFLPPPSTSELGAKL